MALALNSQNERILQDAFDEYVPAFGCAETIIGEVVRCVCKIIYRYENDGDMIGDDYDEVNPASCAAIELMEVCKYSRSNELSKMGMFLERNLVNVYNNRYTYETLIEKLIEYTVHAIENAKELEIRVPNIAKSSANMLIEDLNRELREQRLEEEEEESDEYY